MPPMFRDKGRKQIAKLGLELQQKLLHLIAGGKQIIVDGVGHNIHTEKPEALINPVIEMTNTMRENKQNK